MSDLQDIRRFHRRRQMFAYLGSELVMAKRFDERSHEAWLTEEHPAYRWDRVPRGFVLHDSICWYVGSTFEETDFPFLIECSERLIVTLQLSLPVFVYNGMVPGTQGQSWQPCKRVGVFDKDLRFRVALSGAAYAP